MYGFLPSFLQTNLNDLFNINYIHIDFCIFLFGNLIEEWVLFI